MQRVSVASYTAVPRLPQVLPGLRASVATSASDRRGWLTVFLFCLPVYLLTAHYVYVSGDTQSAVLPAWQLVHHSNLWVEHVHPRVFWAVPAAGHHLASNRMPGLELVNLPFEALLFWLGPSMVPGALTAAFLTAATVGFLFLVFRRLTSTRLALIATGAMAFGTSLWTISAAEVWPHTVDAFCLALAMYALSRRRQLLAGVAIGCAITARPHVALIALVVGLGLGWTLRSLRPVLSIGVPAAAGLAFVVGWNDLVFGHPSISGGYASYVSTNLTTSPSGASSHLMLSNLAGFLLSPQRGLFVFLPVSLVLILGVRSGWRAAEPWMRLVAVGGVAYTLLQLRINDFGGGDSFYGSRLSTELVVCMAPLAVVSLRSGFMARGWVTRCVRSLTLAGVGLQAVGAVGLGIPQSSGLRPWHTSPVLDILTARPPAAFALLLFTFGASLWLLQREPSGLQALERRLVGR